MKNFISIIALALFVLIAESAYAQKLNIWKGGQAGHLTDWNYPRNWSLGMVPDWTCAAVIEQNFQNGAHYPIIAKTAEPVQFLVICSGARLEISTQGRLKVELPDACLLDGELMNRGQFLSDEGSLVDSKRMAGFQ
ncbi:MAG: hypothetical protein ACKVU0_04370 [Saprospiraceae bacterium]